MVHCSACNNRKEIGPNEAVKCQGCNKYYHKNCSDKMTSLGFLSNGGFVKCCGTQEDIEHAKELLKLKRDLKANSSTFTGTSSQQIFSQLALDNLTEGESDLYSKQLYTTKDSSQHEVIKYINDANISLWNKIQRLLQTNQKENQTNQKENQANQKEMINKLTDMEYKVDQLNINFNQHQKLIDETLVKVDLLEKRLDLKNEQQIDETITELNERKRRENNLIFYNVPESRSPTKDKEVIESLFTGSNFKDFIVRVVRLNYNQGNKRTPTSKLKDDVADDQTISCSPIKVTFLHHECIQWLLMNFKDIDFKGISFSGDKTLRQREQYNKAKEELNSRRSRGELKLKIVNINGIPRVVDSGKNTRSSINITQHQGQLTNITSKSKN